MIAKDGVGTIREVLKNGMGCWVCNRGGCKHFLIEWDAYIHARCAVKAMADADSDTHMVIGHKHTVELDFSLEEEC